MFASFNPHFLLRPTSSFPNQPSFSLYSIKHRYNSKVMKGFAGSFSDEVKAEIEKVRFLPSSRFLPSTNPFLPWAAPGRQVRRGGRQGHHSVDALPSYPPPFDCTAPTLPSAIFFLSRSSVVRRAL